jgi:hypothetical protein
MKATLEERFWAKVDKTATCWDWIACTDGDGYGRFWVGRAYLPSSTRTAHRIAYEMLVGPIADGLTLDHLCRNIRCVRPTHLEPVTPEENGLRGNTYQGINARKTHCVNGHEFTPANTYVGTRRDSDRERRTCITCRNIRKRAARARLQNERAA